MAGRTLSDKKLCPVGRTSAPSIQTSTGTKPMAMPKSKGKQYEVDGRPYCVAISVSEIDEADAVHLRVTIQAGYGTHSFCTVKGLLNRSYWHDYPDIEEMRQRAISITPAVVCHIIRHALNTEWKPKTEKANRTILLDNQFLATLPTK